MPAYLLTWTTCGTWLHGDRRGSIDRHRNRPDTPVIEPNEQWEAWNRSMLAHEPVTLTPPLRAVVESAIVQHCTHRNWQLHAINVRTNHVHAVCIGEAHGSAMIAQLKARATRALREHGTNHDRVWTKGGSARHLHSHDSFARAIHYVLHEQ